MSHGKRAFFYAFLFILSGCSTSDDYSGPYKTTSYSPYPAEYSDDDDEGSASVQNAILNGSNRNQAGYWDDLDAGRDDETAKTAAAAGSASAPTATSIQTAAPENTTINTESAGKGRPPRATTDALNTETRPARGRPPIPGRKVTPPAPRAGWAAIPAQYSRGGACMDGEKIVKMKSGGFACCPPDGEVCYPLRDGASLRCDRGETLTQMNTGEMACCPLDGDVCYPAK
ncbi:MAG: hypothetical protein LBQ49_02665 [Rickettsiales bacterium]|nr:hypothetical protein [Rickettsiales bacterium]